MEILLIILKIVSLLYSLALNSSYFGLCTAGLPASSNLQVYLGIYFAVFPLYIFNCFCLSMQRLPLHVYTWSWLYIDICVP